MQFRTLALWGVAVVVAGGIALTVSKTGGSSDAVQQPAASAAPVPPLAPGTRLVDINSASRDELMTLPGIGGAEADRIIANRPYLTKSHLVAKKVLELGPYDALRGRIIAVQPEQPKADKS